MLLSFVMVFLRPILTFQMSIVTAVSAVTVVLAMGLLPAKTHAQTPAKTEAIKTLRDWRQRLLQEDEKAIKSQKEIVMSLAKAGVQSTAELRAQSDIEPQLNAIENVDIERVEMEAQRRIVDQLTFAVDTKWSGADLKTFLEAQLLDLALVDLSEPGQGGWWKFLIKSSIALRDLSEPGADPIRFLEAYMAESTVLDPKPIGDVVKSRTYIGR